MELIAGHGKMKKTPLRTHNLALILIVAGILVAVNIIAQRYFTRVDLTENREYTIAPATRNVLAGLDDVVNVTGYFSRKLPPYLINLRRQIRDILEEYRAYSRGKLEVEFVDPTDDPLLQQKVRMLGIPQVQLQIIDQEGFQATGAFLGLALYYGTNKEIIPFVQDTGGLEYELTSVLIRLTSPEKKRVGWVSGAPEEEPARGVGSPIRQELSRSYTVEEIAAASLEKVPEGVHTLVIDGPRNLSDQALFAIDQFLMRGGRGIFLVDHFAVPAGNLFSTPIESGVHELLEWYGVRVNQDVVVEPRRESSALAAFSSGMLSFRIPYPFWARVSHEFLNREHPVTGKLEAVVLPWTSSLEVVLPEGSAVKAEVLAGSSGSSSIETAPYDFSPQRNMRAPGTKGEAKSRPLIVLLNGKFRSFWLDKTPPDSSEEGEAPEVLPESPETSILVVGNSRLVKSEFLMKFPEDGIFMLNAVDWMTLGPELIGIRSRASAERTLPAFPARAKSVLKVANIVGVPVLLAFFGLTRLALRRRRRNEV
jgi:gliding-associated putative ABC transporter substrate-binding component GldG